MSSRAAESPAEFELRVNRVLARGGLSHVAFFHETRSTRAGAVRHQCHLLRSRHAGRTPVGVPGCARRRTRSRGRRAPRRHPVGRRWGGDTAADITDLWPRHGPAAHDSERRRPGPAGSGRAAEGETERQGQRDTADGRTDERHGSTRRARASDTCASRSFPGANGQRFARELDRALAELADCTRLIIDLRGNLGGFVGSLRLMSYLTPDRIPVGYSLTRSGEDRKLRPDQLACIDKLPKTKLDMLKMAFRFMVVHRDRSIRLVTEGLGPKPFHGRIVMLVNEHTLSAGEMVAAFAAENGLATLVGTRTGGQVLGGANFSVGHGFILRLPAAGWYTWRGSIVEGRGVSPDVEVPLSLAELRQGKDNQLEAAVATVNTM